jgi:hypothetical protein
MPGWRFQWRVVLAFVIFGAFLGSPIPPVRFGRGGQSIVLTSVIWQNILVLAVIGFLIGSSAGGFVNKGWYADESGDRAATPRFSLSGLLFVVTWVALLLGVIVFIAKQP